VPRPREPAARLLEPGCEETADLGSQVKAWTFVIDI